MKKGAIEESDKMISKLGSCGWHLITYYIPSRKKDNIYINNYN